MPSAPPSLYISVSMKNFPNISTEPLSERKATAQIFVIWSIIVTDRIISEGTKSALKLFTGRTAALFAFFALDAQAGMRDGFESGGRDRFVALGA